MAVIISQITIGDLRLIVTDSAPNVGSGLSAELGSMVIVQGQGAIYLKTGPQNVDWKISTVDAEQLGLDLTDIQAQIAAEVSARETLSARVDQLDNGNDELLAQEIARAQAAEAALGESLEQEVANRVADVSAEEARALAAESVLQSNIDAEASSRQAADSSLQSNIDSEASSRQAEDLTFVKLDGSREMTGDLHMGHAAVVAPPSSGGTLVGMQQLVPPSQIANIMISGMGENGQFYIIGSSSDWQSRYLALSSNEGQSYTVLDAGNWDSADGFIEDVKINAAGIIFVKKAINNSMDRILLYSLDNGQTFLPGGLPSDFGGNFEFVTSGPDLILTHGIQNPDTGNVNYKIQRTSDFGATYSLINSTENVPELQTLTIQVSGSTLAFTHWDGVLQRQKLSFSINGGNSFQSVDFGPNNGFTLKDSNHVIVGRQPSDWTQPVSFDSVNLNTLVATSLDGFNAVVADLKQAGKMLYIRGFSGGKFFANAMGMMMDNTLYHGADIDAVSVVAGEGSGSSAGQSTPAVYHSIKYVADGVDAHDAATKGQLDSEVSRAQSVENSLQSQINSESSSRLSADQQLQSNIDAEASSRQAADESLQTQINNILSNVDPAALDSLSEVVAAFQAADENLNDAISALGTGSQSGLAQEISDRQAGDANLQSQIDDEEAARISGDQQLQSDIDAEEARALLAESGLQSQITQEIADRISDVNAEETRALAAEAALQSSLNQEISDRQAAISSLSLSSDNLDGYAQDVRSDLDQEILDREAADSALDLRIDVLEADAVTKAYVDSADSALQSQLSQEVIDRQSGDTSTLASAQSYTDQKVADLVNSAPAVLDTLKELSDALGGDENFASTIAGQIGSVDDKIDQEIADRTAEDLTFVKLDGSRTMAKVKVEQNNVKFDITAHSVLTSGSVNAVVASIEPSVDSVELFKVMVVGMDSSSKDSVVYERTVRVKNIGGTLGLGTIQSDYTSEDISMVDANCTFIVNSSNVDVRVTGVDSKDITWKCVVHRVR